ncbi:hypothetical protein OCJ37_19755 [Xanthomonas sp. AM6]|uniref:hypothetical protein n=1 Tax=Xanthomonas sp. AM6 TaxID=2982531 RepID=UPI0021D91633|nr:hypothetical protein [Xanthomonas sp. AM6]UYB52169.1 hypothetical protein OCJ37_19755 [Xanthomonas sp. AM6]
MAMEMCPLSADWGSWADWAAVVIAAIAAGATFWAVLVAMRTSRTAVDEARRMRDEDRAARLQADKDRAVARAIVLDHELYVLGGEIRRIADVLSHPEALKDPVATAAWAAKQMPVDPLPMLTRFAGDLDAFGAGGAAKLLSALSSWYVNRTFLDQGRFQEDSALQIADDLRSIALAFETFLEVLRSARELTLHWATDGKGDLAETDF